MGEILKYVIESQDNASGDLLKISKAAEAAEDSLTDLQRNARRAADELEELGDAADDSEKALRGMNARTAKFSENMGEASSIASGLGGALGHINPALGDMGTFVADSAGGLEAFSKAGFAAMGPIGALTAAVGLAASAYAMYAEEQARATEEMQAAKEAAEELQKAIDSYDLTKATAQIDLMAAQGKITARERAEVAAQTKAQAAAEDVLSVAIEKNTAAQTKLNEAKEAETAAEEAFAEARTRASSSDKIATGRALDASRAARNQAQKQAAETERELAAIEKQIQEHADIIMDTFDALEEGKEKAKADSAKKTGEAADVAAEEFDRLIKQANQLSTAPTTKLQQMNDVLAELQARLDSGTGSADKLNAAIQAVTQARDSEAAKTAAADAQKQAAALRTLSGKTTALTRQIDVLARSFEEPRSAADKLRDKQLQLRQAFQQVTAQAERQGVAGTQAFADMAAAFEKSMLRIQTAINQLEPPDPEGFAAKLGAGLKGVGNFLTAGGGQDGGGLLGAAEGAMGVMASGGASALAAAAGPAGGLVSGALALGQQGAAAYDAEVNKKAQEAASERQEQMQAEADKMAEQGFSAEQIEAAGLGAADIAAAGEVTDADIAKAEEETDRGEVMGEVVKQAVEGLIEGIKSIIIGLPHILAELIPMLLTELPGAIIASTIKTIPKLVRSIVFEIPKGIYLGALRAWDAIWGAIKSFFKSVLSFGILQSGGYIPKDGPYVLHQGERVVPSSGASTGTAARGLSAFAGPPGANVTIQTQVIDPDTIPALTRIIDRSVGSFGSTTTPMLGELQPLTEV